MIRQTFKSAVTNDAVMSMIAFKVFFIIVITFELKLSFSTTAVILTDDSILLDDSKLRLSIIKNYFMSFILSIFSRGIFERKNDHTYL